MEHFHFAGHYDAGGTGMISAIGRIAGNPNRDVRRLPWRLFTLALEPTLA